MNVGAIETGALLAIVEQAGMAIATLIEGLERDEFLRSRLTRREVSRQVRTLADSLDHFGPEVRQGMPELDWAGWEALRPRLFGASGQEQDEALWFACQSPVPATLLWLRFYKQHLPALFRMLP